MSVVMQPALTLKSLIPGFRLSAAKGEDVHIWDFKGRKNLVLAFFPDGPCAECEVFLDAVKEKHEHYLDDNAIVLTIVRGTEQRAVSLLDDHQPPFPILYDSSGQVTQRYTDSLPAVFVADKFGELYAQWIVGPGGLFPSQKQILDVLDLINLECPE